MAECILPVRDTDPRRSHPQTRNDSWAAGPVLRGYGNNTTPPEYKYTVFGGAGATVRGRDHSNASLHYCAMYTPSPMLHAKTCGVHTNL